MTDTNGNDAGINLTIDTAGDSGFARGGGAGQQYQIPLTSTAGNHNHTFTTSTKGSSAAHNNMPPFSVVNFIIKT